MALYERLLGRDDAGNSVDGRISIHSFQSVVASWARGKATAVQARAILAKVSGLPLSPAEEVEVQALVSTVPTGSTTANKADRALRLLEIDQLLLAAEAASGFDEVTGNLVGLAPFTTPSALKTLLGV